MPKRKSKDDEHAPRPPLTLPRLPRGGWKNQQRLEKDSFCWATRRQQPRSRKFTFLQQSAVCDVPSRLYLVANLGLSAERTAFRGDLLHIQFFVKFQSEDAVTLSVFWPFADVLRINTALHLVMSWQDTYKKLTYLWTRLGARVNQEATLDLPCVSLGAKLAWLDRSTSHHQETTLDTPPILATPRAMLRLCKPYLPARVVESIVTPLSPPIARIQVVPGDVVTLTADPNVWMVLRVRSTIQGRVDLIRFEFGSSAPICLLWQCPSLLERVARASEQLPRPGQRAFAKLPAKSHASSSSSGGEMQRWQPVQVIQLADESIVQTLHDSKKHVLELNAVDGDPMLLKDWSCELSCATVGSRETLVGKAHLYQAGDCVYYTLRQGSHVSRIVPYYELTEAHSSAPLVDFPSLSELDLSSSSSSSHDSSLLCVSCHEKQRSVLLLPCRHFVLCSFCTIQRTCPSCHQVVENSIKQIFY